MSLLKTIIPLFIILGLLQAAVLALPLIYWRFQPYLHPIHRFLLGTFFCFIAFILHPLIVITLITFTIAPTLLSMRHGLSSRLSTIYTALLPSGLPAALPSPLSRAALGSRGFLEKGGFPQSNRDWLLTMLSSYVGWKALGALPFVVVVAVFLALRGRREEIERDYVRVVRGEDEDGEGRARGTGVERKETGVGLRSRRTDI